MRQLGAHLDSLRTDVPIACICHVGGRSAVVADALAHHGYDAANVVGGMHAWEAAGLPVERG
jgi:rhodanese-related sulfurtransferase